MGGGVLPVLKAVDGDVDLVHACIDQLLPTAGQEGTVGGDGGLEALLLGQTNECGQVGVGQGLTHDVVVEVLGHTQQAVGDGVELGQTHAPRGAGRPGAEGAAPIADIGDLDVGAGIHGASPF